MSTASTLLEKLSEYGLNPQDWEIKFMKRGCVQVQSKKYSKLLLHGKFIKDRQFTEWKELSLRECF